MSLKLPLFLGLTIVIGGVIGIRITGSFVNAAVEVPQTISWWQPEASERLKWQLQLQGDVKLIPGVDVYAVDSGASQESINAAKATGARLMCYISAGSAENWREDFEQIPASVIGNAYNGWPGEWWLDIRQIEKLAPIMRARMDVCAAKGFDVLDPDNINGYENDTGFTLSQDDAVAYIRWLAAEAHLRGLAFSLKNGESLLDRITDDIDMMQSESCYFYKNCQQVAKLTRSNKPVFSVEYEDLIDEDKFHSQSCRTAREFHFTMIYRDTALLPEGVYASCRQGEGK